MSKKIDSRFIDAEMATDSELAVETAARQAADNALSARLSTLENNTNIVTSVNGQTGNVTVPVQPVGEIDGGDSDSVYGGNGTFDGGGAA